MVHDGKTLIDAWRRRSRGILTAIVLADVVVLLSMTILLRVDSLLHVNILMWIAIDLIVEILVGLKIFMRKMTCVDRGCVVDEILRGDGQRRVVSTLAGQVCFHRLNTRGEFGPKV